jgi:hypothetical protein
MSLQQLAQSIQSQGRGNDTMLVHMTPGEVAGLQALAQAHGGSLTVNPQTGLPEAGFLENILPMVAGAAAMFIPGMQGVGAYMLASGVGGLTALATKRKGERGFDAFLRGALGGAGGAGLGGLAAGAMGAGAAGAAGGVGAETLAAAAGTGVEGALATGMTQAEMLSAQTAGMGLGQAEMLAAQTAGMGLTQAEMLAAQTAGMGPTQAEMLAAQTAGMGPEQPELLFSKVKDWWDETPLKDKLYTGKQLMELATPEEAPAQQVRGPAVGTPGYNPASVDMPGISGGGGGGPYQGSAARIEVPTFAQLAQARAQQRAGFSGGWGAFPSRRAAEGGLMQLAEGGAVHMQGGGFVASADVVSALGKGSTDAGLRALAELGAEPIRGPGDGQSDSIHATINGAPVARVADGEAYFPPQAVARIGGGDHSKGAQRLYAMMDKVRKQAYGREEQVKPVDIDEVLA